MTCIVLVPLDDRPPTWWFPQRIARIAGLELLLPSRSLLGKFLEPGDCEAITHWLEGVAGSVDGVIVAADMLAYGGLVASRRMAVSLEMALQRIETLGRIHQSYPALPILVASVIMRISITSGSTEQAASYKDIIRYSELDYLVKNLGREDLKDELTELCRSIPANILMEYLSARQRNHAINRKLVEMRAAGILSDLILLQEDASPAGPHLLEQQALYELGQELGLNEEIKIYPGADEGTQTLLARWMNRNRQRSIELHFTAEWGADLPAPFEDRPLRETTFAHLDAAGFKLTEGSSAPVLWVHTPAQNREIDRAVNHLADFIHSGRIVAIADARVPNGSDPDLMQQLLDRRLLDRLAAYAGWNTAGNTLGTAIAHLSAYLSSQGNGWSDDTKRQQTAFLWERYIDDWGYQAVVRDRVAQSCVQRQLDPLNLGSHWTFVEALVRDSLGQWVEELSNALGDGPHRESIGIFLPWSRIFEVEVIVGQRIHSLNVQPDV